MRRTLVNAGAVWCVSEQLTALAIINQPKKRQQNPQLVEKEDYGLKDEKNDIEKENTIMTDLYIACSMRQFFFNSSFQIFYYICLMWIFFFFFSHMWILFAT